MVPTVGRVVHYNDQGMARPAMVTHVWDSTTVNLNVFNDSLYPSTWMGSTFTIARVVQGNEYGQWQWPPISK